MLAEKVRRARGILVTSFGEAATRKIIASFARGAKIRFERASGAASGHATKGFRGPAVGIFCTSLSASSTVAAKTRRAVGWPRTRRGVAQVFKANKRTLASREIAWPPSGGARAIGAVMVRGAVEIARTGGFGAGFGARFGARFGRGFGPRFRFTLEFDSDFVGRRGFTVGFGRFGLRFEERLASFGQTATL